MNWLVHHWGKAWPMAWEHAWLSLLPIVVGVAIALPIGVAVARRPWARRISDVLSNIVYTIPSLALFAVLPGVLGFGFLSPLNVVVALTLYTVAMQVKSIPEALAAVDANVLEAADAIGWSPVARLVKVDLPLAAPVLIANLRVIAAANISMVAIGSVIGVGGLGQLFLSGYQRDYPDLIVAGILAVLVLALAVDLALVLLGRALTPWTRPTRPSAQKDGIQGGRRRGVQRQARNEPGTRGADNAGDRLLGGGKR
ncbi:MAG: ABC transporter permease [Segniliparus sp.]|uniref:ABC transporter permease n=1 Tax=Segniliparus sp. TaxID=2804064 RepID=UPI003F377E75